MIMDTTWGEGLPTATKLSLLDAAWGRYYWEYAGFQNLDTDCQGLYDLYRPEIAAGASHGRFAAIMQSSGISPS